MFINVRCMSMLLLYGKPFLLDDVKSVRNSFYPAHNMAGIYCRYFPVGLLDHSSSLHHKKRREEKGSSVALTGDDVR